MVAMCDDKGNNGGSAQSCAEMKNSPYDDKIVPVHDKIRDCNRIPVVHRDLLAGVVFEALLFIATVMFTLAVLGVDSSVLGCFQSSSLGLDLSFAGVGLD